MSTQTDVQEMYIGLLGRAADKAGYDYWVEQIDAGILTVEDVRANIVTYQPEYLNGIGAMTRSQGVNQLYINLFGRPAEPEGLDYWVNGGGKDVNFDQLVLALINGASPEDRLTLDNRDTVAIAYTDSDYGSADPFDIDSAKAIIADVDSSPESVENALDLIENGEIISGETYTLTIGQDNIVGEAGEDLIIGISEDENTDTFTLGDTINGGGGIDTLRLTNGDDELLLQKATISNIEKLEVINKYDDFDELNLAKVAYDSVLVDYQGTNHYDYLYIDGIDGQSDLTIDNVTGYDGYSFYRNYDEVYDQTEGVVSVSNTISNFDAVSQDDYSYYYGYNYFAQASEINHAFNLTDLAGGDEGFFAYDYIGTEVDGAVINSTTNITNADTPDYYSYVYLYVENETGEASDVTAVVNITDSDGVDFEFDTYYNGDSGTSDEITYNVDNFQNTYDGNYLYTYGFEAINLNVLSDSEVYGFYDYQADGNGQVINIVADGDFTVTGYTEFDGDVGDVMLNVSGSGNVDLFTTYLGDGDAIDDVVVDASASTGDFSIDDHNGNASSITSGTGDDDITVGSDETAVSTGEGDDRVDTAGYDFGASVDSAKLAGGAGSDTIAIDDGANLDTAAAANMSGFEVLDVTLGTGTYDMDVETSLKDVVAAGTLNGPVIIDNAASDVALTFKVFNAAGNELTMNQKDGTGKSDELALTLIANDDNKNQIVDKGTETIALVTAAEYETVDLLSIAATKSEDSSPGKGDALVPADYVNTVTLTAADMATLNVSGIAQAEVIFGDATALTFVDASTNLAGVTIDASAGGIVSGVTLKGSGGDDTYTASANGDLVQGNGGADMITAGAGDDTIRYVDASDSQLLLVDLSKPADGKADAAIHFDEITDFAAAGTDLIELSSSLNLATGDARSDILQKGYIGGNTPLDMQTFIGDGVDFFDTGVVDRATAFADDAADGFLFIDANSDGNFTEADDMMIQITGVTTFDITEIQFG